MSCSPSSWHRGACGCPAAPTAQCIDWLPEDSESGNTDAHRDAAFCCRYITLCAPHTFRLRRESCDPAYASGDMPVNQFLRREREHRTLTLTIYRSFS